MLVDLRGLFVGSAVHAFDGMMDPGGTPLLPRGLFPSVVVQWRSVHGSAESAVEQRDSTDVS